MQINTPTPGTCPCSATDQHTLNPAIYSPGPMARPLNGHACLLEIEYCVCHPQVVLLSIQDLLKKVQRSLTIIPDTCFTSAVFGDWNSPKQQEGEDHSGEVKFLHYMLFAIEQADSCLLTHIPLLHGAKLQTHSVISAVSA